MKSAKTEKALKPSQRESITAFSSKFGTGSDYRSKVLRRKIARIIIIALCILALIYVGYTFTDVILRITELPLEASASGLHTLQLSSYIS